VSPYLTFPVNVWYGVVVADEVQRVRGDPIIHNQGRRQLRVARLRVVELESWVARRVVVVGVARVHNDLGFARVQDPNLRIPAGRGVHRLFRFRGERCE